MSPSGAIDTTPPDALHQLMAVGRHAEAFDLAKARDAAGTADAATCFYLGVLLAARGDTAAALHCYQRAVALAPDMAPAHANLALLHERHRDAAAAEHSHRTACRLDPASIPIRFNLANWLAASPHPDPQQEARALYLEILAREPQHLGAWNNLGTLLFETGYISAAQTAYRAAVTYHPEDGPAHVNLGNVLLHQNALADARAQFQQALSCGTPLAEAHRGLATCYAREGRELEATHHRALGFGQTPCLTLTHRGPGTPVPLLILASAQEGNVPWRFLIDRSLFHTTILATEYLDPGFPLPPHALIFNAIGDADRCAEALQRASDWVRTSQAPVLNAPERVLRTGRLAHARTLADIPGVRLPHMQHLTRDAIATLPDTPGCPDFPLLLRTPGYHGGQFFVRVEHPDALPAALDALPGKSLLVLEFLDGRDARGLFRKFRMMSIGGALYPIHLAIAPHWKVHYFSADMADSAAHRDEEATFLSDPAAHLGPRVLHTLGQLQERIGLDYVGMDFGLDAAGQVLLFEANATMVLQPPNDDPLWDYRRPALQRALEAARDLLRSRAQSRP